MSIPHSPTLADRHLRVAGRVLVATVWSSAVIFGLYILAFYFVGLLSGNTGQWNEVLPGLYDANTRSATFGIGLHFAAGGIILILGCVQLVPAIRLRYPLAHRWLGRVYVVAALLTALGGLSFIAAKGTIGGWLMDVAFTGYGLLTGLAAVQTIRYARAGAFARHRAWGIRLFALAIGSWLYRMDYGFWFLFTGGAGHTQLFRGPFDYFMDFWFYLPNLLVAEVFIGRRELLGGRWAKVSATVAVYLTTAFLVLATYFFTKEFWGPAILGVFQS
ncbi:DUF2306 domain-containing protein [Lewinella sp. IMCC34183]|uniref:DUF2306 domain-containing protein n=1 Tax=Lewinella sp. IMCC34183 TaxID=2248762 RepID=UPI000E23574D|nr:DUF2306 domain-containing protein [Lewinella sp. IMCC34183]